MGVFFFLKGALSFKNDLRGQVNYVSEFPCSYFRMRAVCPFLECLASLSGQPADACLVNQSISFDHRYAKLNLQVPETKSYWRLVTLGFPSKPTGILWVPA